VKLFPVLLSVRSSGIPSLRNFQWGLLHPREFFHLRAESGEPDHASF
jgi:hypothetical protein